MNQFFTLKKSFFMFFIVLMVLSGGVFGALSYAALLTEESKAADEKKLKAIITRAESREISLGQDTDLKSYLVTRNKNFLDSYNEGNNQAFGVSPRAYGQIGKTQDLIVQLGLPQQEINEELKSLMDRIYDMEDTSAYAAKGLYKDDKGEFTVPGPVDLELGKKVIFSQEYTDGSREIATRISDYMWGIIHETEKIAAEKRQQAEYAQNAVFVTVIIMMLVSLMALILLYRMITRPIQHSLAAAELLSKGNLTVHIDTQRRDELGRLMEAINGIGQGLMSVVTDVRDGVSTINAASKTIVAGNTEIAQHTEMQAERVKATTHNMDELTTTVKQNADNAKQANALANDAANFATKGGVVFNNVVETMGAIKESSSKISDIISVIDGIAFQTNILALNAAVEAARAGEQGRGFAVVASEVRTLAQRSTNAAKEITSLINTSVSNVEEGGKQVDEVGEMMGQLVSLIQQVADIMGQITAASQEQSEGIDEVTQSVTQIDEITKQNAQLVERAESEAKRLLNQADNLSQSIQIFQLDERHQTHQVQQAGAADIAPPDSHAEIARKSLVPKHAAAAAEKKEPVMQKNRQETMEANARVQEEHIPAQLLRTNKTAKKDADGNEWDEF